MWNGCWAICGRRSTMHVVTEIDPNTRRAVRAQSLQHRFAGRMAFFDVDDATRQLDRRPHRIPRTQRHACRIQPRWHVRGCPAKSAPAWIPAPPSRFRSSWLTAKSERSSFSLGVGRDADEAASARPALSRIGGSAYGAGSGVAVLEAYPRRGACGDTRSVPQRADQWLAAVSDPGVPSLGAQRISISREALRLPRSIAGRDGAGPCRTPARARTFVAVRGAPVPRRRCAALVASARRAAASARVVRTIICGCRWSTCRYVMRRATPACWMNQSSFLEGRPVNARRRLILRSAGPFRADRRVCTNIVCAPSCSGLRFGEHGLPLMGSGDWNDGMNLVGDHGKGESVWLGFFLYDVLMQFAELARTAWRYGVRRTLPERKRPSCARISNSMAGTVTGIAAPTSTTARRSGRRRNAECQIDSIAQSWSVLSGAGDANARAWRWRPSIERLVRRDDALIQLLDPPFDKSDFESRLYQGLCAGRAERTAANTRMARIWAAMAFAALGDSARAWELWR